MTGQIRLVFTAAPLLAIALAGCDSMTESFDKNYREQFVKSCTDESTKRGAPAEVAAQVCDCAANKSADELGMSDMVNPDEQKLIAIMNACASEVAGVAPTDAAAE